MLTWLGIPGSVAHKNIPSKVNIIWNIELSTDVPYFLIVIEFPPQFETAYKGQENVFQQKNSMMLW